MSKALNITLALIIALCNAPVSHSWGITDWAEDTWDDTTSAVSDGFNAMATSVSDAVDDTTEFFTAISESPELLEVLNAIQKVFLVTVEHIEEAIGDFNVTTWKRLVHDAKYVIYNLPSTVQEYLAKGCNYLSYLVDLELLPFPLDVMKADDFYTVVDCLGDGVFDIAKDWTQEVATTFTNIVGQDGDISSLDFSPMFNDELIKDELNETYSCLLSLARSIEDRKQEDDSVNVWQEATDFFEFNNLTLAVEISFTACTLTCGTAALGFAVSTSGAGEMRPYYTIAMGVDTGTVVGASVGAKLHFVQNMTKIAGSSHELSFGLSIDLPLIPDIIPDVAVVVGAGADDAGEFKKFTLSSDILDFQFGLDGAFSVGYAFSETKWIYTTSDLKDAWNAAVDIIDDKVDTVSDAYKLLTSDILGHGGYFVKATQSQTASLVCPSGISESNSENTKIGNLSVLNLGAIDIFEVVFGNVEGNYECNSTLGYDAVRSLCQNGAHCSFTVDAATLGNVYCDAPDVDLTVIYGCPDQVDVFNLGCYAVNFLTVVDRKWYQDYQDGILDDGWEDRNNGMAKCAKIAKANGYPGFATYNNGMCLMASNLFDEGVYNEQRRINDTSECELDGLGNDVTMNLYAFATSDIAYQDLGCMNITQFAAYDAGLQSTFVTYEEEHYLLQDPYQERKNAVSKCAQIAHAAGYKGFALFDGGKCYISNTFRDSTIEEIRYFGSTETNITQRSCGKGTSYAYNVYQFPYVTISQAKEQGLAAWEIALIVIIPIVVIALCVAGGLWFRKHKMNKQAVPVAGETNYKPPTVTKKGKK
eukprot:CAMPEP_0197022138 /NCGR_PEP_ID=MMETSP1384-20130603/3035_1 /TAXON_ID=29189 /ORGANISM="Ammonia sp." /LENGTH=813 /DNA_ID=CAMNT_0042450111 /DNA_START=31 /DNA_END=2472 /DNA_ORIENTATION=+